MINNYDSIDFWEGVVNVNKTHKSRMFEGEAITEKTVYLHYVIFNRKSGIESIWIPIPSAKMLLGYIQYCFLPEAFYKWIEGGDKVISVIPTKTVEAIILDAEKNNNVSREEINNMKKQLAFVKKLWNVSNAKLITELKSFIKTFNKAWLGDSTKFIYINVFSNASELGEFVVRTNTQTDFSKTFEDKIGLSEEEWMKLCKQVCKDKKAAERFKIILTRELTEVV